MNDKQIRISKLRKGRRRYSVIAPKGYVMRKVIRDWNIGVPMTEIQFDLVKEKNQEMKK